MKFDSIKQKRPATGKSWFHFWQYSPWSDEELPLPENYPHDEWRLYDKCHFWTMAEVDFKLDGYTVYAYVRGERYQLTTEGWVYIGAAPNHVPLLGVDE